MPLNKKNNQPTNNLKASGSLLLSKSIEMEIIVKEE